MVYGDPLRAYQKTKVETADPVELVIMCYDAAIQDLEAAKKLHSNRAIEPCCEKIRHAQDVVTELLVGLDYERGGEIAQNLSRLYNFILRQLIGIASSRDTNMYDHLIHIMSELKEAWEMVRQTVAKSPSGPVPPGGQTRGIPA